MTATQRLFVLLPAALLLLISTPTLAAPPKQHLRRRLGSAALADDDDEMAFKKWLTENQAEIGKLMNYDKLPPPTKAPTVEHEGPEPTLYPTYPEKIRTPSPTPDPNMDDPCSVVNEDMCDPVSTSCVED